LTPAQFATRAADALTAANSASASLALLQGYETNATTHLGSINTSLGTINGAVSTLQASLASMIAADDLDISAFF
jgi:hypothetical protein